ncbi:NAD+ synthase [Parvularcula sp. LCG005]|uniref:NAD+ synthase n=1 Tax=Parvularcula sp. LCG005 TaxID=3078805 RepID=UPI0029433E41|nr:NAD+ synthase [Parvularcula sp. LCG005]WOI54086.1 NAD+ synthase [Parvularcula sp. LCG005]
MDRLRIALAQLNPVVGDIAGNLARISAARDEAARLGADLVVCPELIVSGYPPEDLVLRPAYVTACQAAVEKFAKSTANGPAVLIGSPWPSDDQFDVRPYNASILCADGTVAGIEYKACLPNYGVFDEPRTFRPGPGAKPVMFKGISLGLLICEDMWYPGPAAALAEAGAEIFIVPHGSPFRETAAAERLAQAEARVAEHDRPLIFVNQVGGQDELVFDGGAFCISPGGGRHQAPRFEDGVYLTEWSMVGGHWTCTDGPQAEWPEHHEKLYRALVLGTRDYVQKSGFQKIVLGLSGGIDSAMVAAIAVDALGSENVHCVMLPSRYTSGDSLEDAAICANRLDVKYDTVGIERGVAALDEMMADMFRGRDSDVTEENIQSRLRGVVLMAVSNKFGSMVLTTGNKSEMAVGYATLYGDMNGGYNPLKDVYKTTVFELARWRNAHRPEGLLGPKGEVIPPRIIEKPPSAELREDQKDEDSLPSYEVLDDILHGLIEKEEGADVIAARGHDLALVLKIQRLLYLAEYKRRQAPPGPKVSTKNFGRDRRYPIVNRWRDPD